MTKISYFVFENRLSIILNTYTIVKIIICGILVSCPRIRLLEDDSISESWLSQPLEMDNVKVHEKRDSRFAHQIYCDILARTNPFKIRGKLCESFPQHLISHCLPSLYLYLHYLSISPAILLPANFYYEWQWNQQHSFAEYFHFSPSLSLMRKDIHTRWDSKNRFQ